MRRAHGPLSAGCNALELAQRLADSHTVDLSTLETSGPDDKITARNVLEYLSASGAAFGRLAPGEPALSQPTRTGTDPALEQTRAQLQATAQVHQQVLLQVGSLREQNSLLGGELERLRVAQAQAQSELRVLEAQKQRLQAELERSKPGTFTWLRKLLS